MTLSVQEMSDRFEIDDLVRELQHGHDTNDWSKAAELFAEDAALDLSVGQIGYREFVEIDTRLRGLLNVKVIHRYWSYRQRIKLTGDTAAAMIIQLELATLAEVRDGGGNMIVNGTEYYLSFRRTDQGWRISGIKEGLPVWQKRSAETPMEEYMGFAHGLLDGEG